VTKLDSSFLDIRHLDEAHTRGRPILDLDPRSWVFSTALFTVLVSSFSKYSLSALLPFFFFPVFLIFMGNITYRAVFTRMLPAIPFALFIALFNPLFDQTPLVEFFGISVSGGWISCFSILIRVMLTVSTLLALVALIGFNPFCLALEKMGVPRGFVVQLMFLYRYIFVLGDEAVRMNRARLLRSVSTEKPPFSVYRQVIGYLLLRTLDRAHRIHSAMLSRGFTGTVHIVNPMKFHFRDAVYLAASTAILVFLRIYNGSVLIGCLFEGVL